MNYYLLTFSQLLEQINGIRGFNISTLDRNASFAESVSDRIKGTEIEYFFNVFDEHRHFFRQVEVTFDNLQLNLEQQEITLGLIRRISALGEKADDMLFPLWRVTDKEKLSSVEELRVDLNEWYAVIGDNLNALSELSVIADVLNTNFRNVIPLRDVSKDNIAKQSHDGITITKLDEVYIGENQVNLTGQKMTILLLLAETYINNPAMTVSWGEIEQEIRISTMISREKIVNRVSDLRSQIRKLGLEPLIEIRNTGEGDNAAWKLVKHTS